MAEYDGFEDPSMVVLNKLAVWARVLTLPDNYLHEVVIRGMCRPMGEIQEVQIKLPAGYVGEFVRVRVKIDVTKKLVRFVSITKDTKKVWYRVQYEKMPTFCDHCGLVGHWHQECGTGEHDESKLDWGDFILADGGASRGHGHGNRGSAGRAPRGRGRGRGGRFPEDDGEFHMNTTWRANHVPRNPDGSAATQDMELDKAGKENQSRKRLTYESKPKTGDGSLVNNGKVAEIVGQLQLIGTASEVTPPGESTPGETQPPKRYRTEGEEQNSSISAASRSEADRMQ